MANGLEMMNRKELGSTILFVRFLDKFLDCLNVGRIEQGIRSRNDNLKPYTSEDDPRFEVGQQFIGMMHSLAAKDLQIFDHKKNTYTLFAVKP